MMKRCKICKGLGDVRSDGICSCCYDARMAGKFGISYGKFVALYGHNLGRIADTLPEIRRKCPVCCQDLSPTAGKNMVFCSSSCAARAEEMRKSAYSRRNAKKAGGE